MSTGSPRVTICMPNLNKRPFLEERMESLLAQSYQDWELIVRDGFSDDGSWEYLSKLSRDPRVQMFQSPRRGLYAAWNECLERASAEYIYIATSDDSCEPQLLERLVAPLERYSQISLSVCDFHFTDAASNIVQRRRSDSRTLLGEWLHAPCIRDGKTEFILHALLGPTIWVTMTSVLFRRSLLNRIGYFPRNRGSLGDVEWTARASLASDIAWTPETLATFRVYDSQATPKEFSPGALRTIIESFESVLDDPSSGIPEEWRATAQWREQLLSGRRAVYRTALDLHRWTARGNPRKFLASLKEAVAHDPGWLLSQALRGFSLCPEENFDYLGTAKSLISALRAPWPPTAMSDCRPASEDAGAQNSASLPHP